jgi:hypothetical protein
MKNKFNDDSFINEKVPPCRLPPSPHFPPSPGGSFSVRKRGKNDRKIDSKPVCHNPSCLREDSMLKFEEEKS